MLRPFACPAMVPSLRHNITLLLALTTSVSTCVLTCHLVSAQEQAAPPGPSAVAGDVEMFLPRPIPFVTPIDAQVLAVAFSLDGKRLVTAGEPRRPGQGHLKIWEAATGRELVKGQGIRGVRTVAFSRDGAMLATGDLAGHIKLRDAATLEERLTVNAHADGVNSLAFSADGEMLVSAGRDRTAKLWDAKQLREQQVFAGHTDMVSSVAFFKHGQAFVSGSRDRTARIWDIKSGKEKLVLSGHQDALEAVAVSPDDTIVASAGWDRTIKFWDAQTGKETANLLETDGSVNALAFSRDGKLLAGATAGGSLYFWDVKTRKLLATRRKHEQPVWALAFSPDGKMLASGSSDNTAKIWDVSGKKEPTTIVTADIKPVRALAYAGDGQVVAIAAEDKTVQIVDARSGKAVRLLKGHVDTVTCLAFSPDGGTLASGSFDRTVRLWDPMTGKERRVLEGHAGGIYALAFAPGGKKLASASEDKTVKLWDSASGAELATLKGHETPIRALAFSPDGLVLTSGSADGTIRAWYLDKPAPAESITLKAHEQSVRALAFSGDLLASAGDDGTVRLWQADPGKRWKPLKGKPRLLRGHKAAVSALAFSPSGRSLVSAGQDGLLIVWDPVLRTPRTVLDRHKSPVTALAMHPRGLDVLSGSQDGAALRWPRARARASVPVAKKLASPEPIPALKSNLQEYYHSFKDDRDLDQNFNLDGVEPDQCVHFEPAGLRMSFPVGHPGRRIGTGLATNFPIKGDFEITMGYEVLQEPPAADGQGTGLYLWVDLDTPDLRRAILTRAGRQYSTWLHLVNEAAGLPPTQELRVFPAKSKTGRLRLVRAGSTVAHYVAEEAGDNFTLLRQHRLGPEDVRSVRIGGHTGGPRATLDFRVTGLRIRAESLPDTLATEAEGDGTIAWLLIALSVFLAVILSLGVWLYVRRRRAQPAARTEAKAAAPLPAISFACPSCARKLRAKATMAGKKIKCPSCAKMAVVPGPASTSSSGPEDSAGNEHVQTL
jgi:WD40 repeat protein